MNLTYELWQNLLAVAFIINVPAQQRSLTQEYEILLARKTFGLLQSYLPFILIWGCGRHRLLPRPTIVFLRDMWSLRLISIVSRYDFIWLLLFFIVLVNSFAYPWVVYPVDQIKFVCDQGYLDVLVTEFADLSDPVFQAQESAVIGDVIHKENANRKSVVNCGYELEFLRARSVPDLSSYSLIAIWEWYRLEFVFDTVILFRFWNEAPVADVQK